MSLTDGRSEKACRSSDSVEGRSRAPHLAAGEGRGRAAIASLRAQLITYQREYAGAVRLGVGRHPDRIDLTVSDAPAFLKKPVARLTIHALEDGSFQVVDRRRDPARHGVRSWCETEHRVMQQVRNVAAQVSQCGTAAPCEFPVQSQVLSRAFLFALVFAGLAVSVLAWAP